ncbi:hypothetical protein COV53_01595 [Candidatus Gottesmanbacteria bacterium CG11_big_fil_rev_8_21_14_0_20_37_11]|uniref:Uncharacterized protein n=3 Tax=Candidatus Gottesmaniibacteriota TaxID=1752720 RepID=A0A2M7RQF6_9BACT|nr:MAG: hypothetical protein AUJ73_02335 [Candidatus Gottesmanbacteria bacterium CG1_02_37_22]PIR08714.1 MAG: hypothetical protein COV53_01595 [Candidatus Gottesmanbacteria bacterium CG11_big_fil_rev_8_21_14_0_20_37_11]PIZ02546.1 MAG: hypothetical protein COY59_04210 [Candidatus Gottesmanbacteria bacterium CG_4_10_14_0_8_um_filter_37_24]
MLAEEVETTNKIDNLKQTEPEVHNETTKVSQNWLKQAKDKVLRWSGHGILTAVSEGFVRVGGAFTYIGAEFLRRKGEFMSIAKTAPDFTNAISALPADQVPLVYQALDQAFKTIPLVGVTAGLIGGITGGVIGWQGVKHSNSTLEKFAFWGSKVASLAAYAFAPALAPLTNALSLTSTLFGMRHRK